MATSPDTTPKHGQVFRLLDLPPELYSHICKLAVTSDTPLLAENMASRYLTVRAMQQPPISRVCRVLRQETLQTFYTTTSFRFYDTRGSSAGLEAWVRTMMHAGRWRQGCIEEVFIYTDHPNPYGHVEWAFLDKDFKLVELGGEYEDPVRGKPFRVDLYRLTIAELPEGEGWRGRDVKAARAEIMDAIDPLAVSG